MLQEWLQKKLQPCGTKYFKKGLYKRRIMWYNIYTVYLDSGMTSFFTPVYVSGLFY